MSSAYFQEYAIRQAFQPGGVSQWSIGKAAHRVMTTGKDETGLGRWAWTRYQGSQNITLRVITAYRPVANKKGPLSVWNQQKTFFDKTNREGNPRDLFTIDLLSDIRTWKECGDQIVLMLDVNDDVRNCDFSTQMLTIGLEETITSQHGDMGPSTYERGTRPIDGIYVSPTLRGLRCGYLDFTFDHRALWMDIPVETAFGHSIPQTVARRARRLKCNDPRIVAKYLDLLIQHLDRHNMFQTVNELFET